MASGPILSWQIDGETVEIVADFWAPKSLQMVTVSVKLKDAYSLAGKLWLTWQHIKKQRHYFANKGPSNQSYGFSIGHVLMWELDCEESWALKNWCFWTVVLEKTIESLLDCKEVQPVHPKGDQCSLEGLILKMKLQYFGHLMRRVGSLEKPWCWERLKVGGDGDNRGWDGWMYHQLNRHEFEQAPRVGDGQGGLGCCSPWGCKELDMTELNWLS